MELIGGISAMKQAETSTKIAYAVAEKVMDTTSALQTDLINQMFEKMGIGGNFNEVA